MTPPERIVNDTGAATLTFYASGAPTRIFMHESLRRACPCARCRSISLDGATVDAPVNVKIIALESMGYGLQLSFDDGHDRGIFPWSYFERLAYQI